MHYEVLKDFKRYRNISKHFKIFNKTRRDFKRFPMVLPIFKILKRSNGRPAMLGDVRGPLYGRTNDCGAGAWPPPPDRGILGRRPTAFPEW